MLKIFLPLLILVGFFALLFNNNVVVKRDLTERYLLRNSEVQQESTKLIRVNYKEGDYFFDSFDEDRIIEESNVVFSEFSDKYWWVNSGAYLHVENGIGKTIQGQLEIGNEWQKKYKSYNSSETDKGQHPQNIFRLVTRTKWKNFQQESYYKINKYILSGAKERSESNGILLFNRYQDGDNLYYTGIRVDGAAVIKKKIRGRYFTMAYEPVYLGMYDRKKNPNILPLGKWIGVRSEIKDNEDDSVDIKVYIDREKTGNWELVAEATDDGKKYGGKAIREEGYAGIRTDFMDVEFDDYRIEELSVK